jgi:Ca-activated chloride channel homolog
MGFRHIAATLPQFCPRASHAGETVLEFGTWQLIQGTDMTKQMKFWLAGVAAVALVAGCEQITDGDNESAEAAPEEGATQDSVTVTGKAQGDMALEASPPPQAAVRAAPMPTGGMTPPQQVPQPMPGDVDTEEYEDVEQNPVKLVSEEPVSTFSIDVDTASYANVRRFLEDGVLPPMDAVRIEELVNYFDYAYPNAESAEEPFATSASIVPSPWGEGRDLVQIGVQGYELIPDEQPPVNLTLLVDVSGSMSAENKLPLAKKAIGLMLEELDEDDTISIAVYAGAAGEILAPTPVSEKQKIYAAFENLSAGGSTAGGEGLRLAYSLAERNFQEDGVNRVMILTDGDFNVGINDPERLEDFVSRKRDSGVYLSVMGFGQGNYNDALMQKIAQAGNGTAGYVDTLNEARKLLSDDLSANLFTIADDVKIQVEFNPARVAEYRLIGYETRMLNREDFNNDAVDAGDIGSGASVTAIYEIAEVGSDGRLIDESRYGEDTDATGDDDEFAFLKIRWKAPGEDTSTLITRPITVEDQFDSVDDAPAYTRFATAVAGFGQLLKGGKFIGEGFGYDQVIELAQSAKGEDPFGYRAEFVQLARSAKTAAAQAALESDTVPERR